jgi:hypothetical protein
MTKVIEQGLKGFVRMACRRLASMAYVLAAEPIALLLTAFWVLHLYERRFKNLNDHDILIPRLSSAIMSNLRQNSKVSSLRQQFKAVIFKGLARG